MKLICINNKPPWNLVESYIDITIDKIYDGELCGLTNNHYEILDDSNQFCIYNKSCFTPLTEWRDKQINEILK